MDHLVSVKRMDRTGRIQTRWVRADRVNARAAAIPPPTAVDAPQGRAYRDDVLGGIRDVAGFTNDAVENKHDLACAVLATFQKAASLTHTRDHQRTLAALRGALKKMDPDDPHAGKKFEFVLVEHLYGTYFEVKSKMLGNPFRHGEIEHSALYYVGALDQDALILKPESVELAVALGHMAAACQIRDMNDPTALTPRTTAYYFHDHPALVGVFDEFRDRAMELAEWVIEHGTDPGAARSHMRGEENTVLSEGML